MPTLEHHMNVKAFRIVLALLVLVLIGVSSVSVVKARQSLEKTQNTRATLYKRCLVNDKANRAADIFRRAEVEVFTRFANDPRSSSEAQVPYRRLAQLAQTAVSNFHPADCTLYK